jgi:hypothetical protein
VTGNATHGVARGVLAALDMLNDAGRIHLVTDGSRVDIVHTVGTIGTVVAHRDLPADRVHTVDRIPLRGSRLAPAGWWIRQHRGSLPPGALWLTHGHTAGRILVDSGVARGERVHCLPLLSHLDARPTGPGRAAGGERSRARRDLGLAPGMRLVLGALPSGGRPGAREWPRAVADLHRPDVVVGLADLPDTEPADGQLVLVHVAGRPAVGLPLEDLLAAVDVYVAAGNDLNGFCHGVAATAAGAALIAVTTDSAAELVLAGRAGHVVRPRSDLVAQAVAAQLDAGVPVRSRPVTGVSEVTGVGELACALLRVYRRVLSVPAGARMGGVA